MRYLAALGWTRRALVEFHDAQRCFPNVFDLDDLGAELLLVCGYPELALGCAENCLLDSDHKAVLVEKTRNAVNAKAKAESLIAEARSVLRNAPPARVTQLLSEAHHINPNDPALAINLGLSLARAGGSADSISLLVSGAMNGPSEWAKTCFANAAFCAIDQGDLERAMLFLDMTMGQIDLELGGREIQDLAADLSGRGIWVEDGTVLEERIQPAAALVVQSATEYQKRAEIPSGALRLVKLYARAINAEQPSQSESGAIES